MPTSTRPIADIARELGLAAEEWLPYGRDKAKVLLPALHARSATPDGKLVSTTLDPAPQPIDLSDLEGMDVKEASARATERLMARIGELKAAA